MILRVMNVGHLGFQTFTRLIQLYNETMMAYFLRGDNMGLGIKVESLYPTFADLLRFHNFTVLRFTNGGHLGFQAVAMVIWL